MSLELLFHAWDFAKTTGRPVVVSEAVAEYVSRMAGKVFTPQACGYATFRRPGGNRSRYRILDRLIAFMGRQPAVHVSAN
jgi:hypothetical protein